MLSKHVQMIGPDFHIGDFALKRILLQRQCSASTDRMVRLIETLSDSLYRLCEPDGFEPNAELLFIHGFVLEPSKDVHTRTCTTDEGQCWPEAWLQDTKNLPRTRIYFVKYDSCVQKKHNAGLFSERTLSESLAKDLIYGQNIGQMRLPVVLIGHDLGGLVIKALCVYLEQIRSSDSSAENKRKVKDFLENVRGIFYFATPHQGFVSDEEESQVKATLWHTLRISNLWRIFGDKKSHFNGKLANLLRIHDEHSAQLNEDFHNLRWRQKWTTAGLGALHRDPEMPFAEEASYRFDTDDFVMVGKNMKDISQLSSCSDSSFQSFKRALITFIGTPRTERGELFKCYISDYVALESVVNEVQSVLSSGKEEVDSVTKAMVLHGMGGIGKSTVGQALYYKLRTLFQPQCSCIVDMGAILSPRRTILDLQDSNLKALRPDEAVNPNDPTPTQEKLFLCYKDASKPLLIYIDNIEDKRDLHHIFPMRSVDQLPVGTRVIISCRNLEVFSELRSMGMENVLKYDVKELDQKSAETLFCKYASISTDLIDNKLKGWKDVQQVVRACSGLPLALKAVGSAFAPLDHQSRKCVLDRLRDFKPVNGLQSDDLFPSLEFSYRQLGQVAERAFRDIVFCFNGSPWNEMGILFKDNLDILKNMALIKEEVRSARRSSLRCSTVKVHALNVLLGLQKCRESHVKFGIEKDIDFDRFLDPAGQFPNQLKKLRLEGQIVKNCTVATEGRRRNPSCEGSDCKHLEELGLISAKHLRNPYLSYGRSLCLRRLMLKDLPDLWSDDLFEILKLSSLESLSILFCDRIEILPDFDKLNRLEDLHLALPSLKKLPDTSRLRSLALESCHLLQEVTGGVGAQFTPKLWLISVYDCEKLKLPSDFEEYLRDSSTKDSDKWRYYLRGLRYSETGGNFKEAIGAIQMPPDKYGALIL
ncbi:hypothetical protein Mapa_017505 [Marchantia paleacea]|nr:hypothetical protein Mapa_017505 [Marchantia paleacea]